MSFRYHSSSRLEAGVERTIFGIRFLCFALYDVLGQPTHGMRDWMVSSLRSSKTALPMREAMALAVRRYR